MARLIVGLLAGGVVGAVAVWVALGGLEEAPDDAASEEPAAVRAELAVTRGNDAARRQAWRAATRQFQRAERALPSARWGLAAARTFGLWPRATTNTAEEIRAIVFSDDGRLVAAFDGEAVWVVEVATGETVATVPAAAADSALFVAGGERIALLYPDADSPHAVTHPVRGAGPSTRYRLSPGVRGGGPRLRLVDGPATHGHLHPKPGLAELSEGTESRDGAVRAWATGKVMHVSVEGEPVASMQRDEDHAITHVAITGDGRQVAYATEAGAARVGSPRAAEWEDRWASGTWNPVRALGFLPFHGLLAEARRDGELTLWSPDSGSPLHTTLVEGAGRITAAAFSPDGRTVATAHGRSQLELWHWGAPDAIQALACGGAEDVAPREAPVGIDLFDDEDTGETPATRRQAELRAGRAAGVLSVAFSPDGGRVAAADWHGNLRVFDRATGGLVHRFHHAEPAQSVAWVSERALAVATRDGGVVHWQLGASPSARRHELPSDAVASHPGTSRLAAAGGGRLVLLDASAGELVRDVEVDSAPTDVAAMSFSPAGDLLAIGSAEIEVRDSLTGARISGDDSADRTVALAWSVDGTRLATGHADGEIRLLDPATGDEVGRLAGRNAPPAGVAFTRDGALLVAGRGGGVSVWDTARGVAVTPVGAAVAATADLALSQDGRTLAIALGNDLVELITLDFFPVSKN